MMDCVIDGIEVKGIACALPNNKVTAVQRYADFGKEIVDEIVARTGVKSIYKTPREQTASDLSYAAACKIIETKMIDKARIGALVFVTQSPDYLIPATAYVLHHRLGLPEECLCFDIHLGCTGFINGLYTLSSIMNTCDVDTALLLVGDTPTKQISPFDRYPSLTLSDCGSATLLQKNPEGNPMVFKVKSIGDEFKQFLVPNRTRRWYDPPVEMVTLPEGNRRSKNDIYINETFMYGFETGEVPAFIKEFTAETNSDVKDFDYVILHQSNRSVLEEITRVLGIENSRVPISLVDYGNAMSASIPLTFSYLRSLNPGCGMQKFLLTGFGDGLSISSSTLYLDMNDVLPVFLTDEFFKDGAVSHE